MKSMFNQEHKSLFQERIKELNVAMKIIFTSISFIENGFDALVKNMTDFYLAQTFQRGRAWSYYFGRILKIRLNG